MERTCRLWASWARQAAGPRKPERRGTQGQTKEDGLRSGGTRNEAVGVTVVVGARHGKRPGLPPAVAGARLAVGRGRAGGNATRSGSNLKTRGGGDPHRTSSKNPGRRRNAILKNPRRGTSEANPRWRGAPAYTLFLSKATLSRQKITVTLIVLNVLQSVPRDRRRTFRHPPTMARTVQDLSRGTDLEPFGPWRG